MFLYETLRSYNSVWSFGPPVYQNNSYLCGSSPV